MKIVKLKNEEFNYLNTASFLDEKWRKLLSNAHNKNGKTYIEISDDNADDLRDQLGEQLQKAGFDLNYNLTKEGVILESLIDLLF